MDSVVVTLHFPPRRSACLAQVLTALAGAVETLGAREGWSDAFVYRVNLVLDELVTNILSYGRRAEALSPDVGVRIACCSGAVRIEVDDDGRAFDPLADAPPAPAVDGPVVPVGGFGLHLVREFTRTMSYRHHGGRNHLTLTLALD